MTDDDRQSRPAPAPDSTASTEHHYRRLEHLAHAIGAGDLLPIDPDLGPEDTSAPSLNRPRPSRLARAHRAHPAILGAIFTGGFLGTLARYAVESAWPAGAGQFPTATFVINASGAFVLGLLLTVLLERLRTSNRLVRPFMVTGVLGGWTTYSTLVVEAVTIGHAGRLALAAGYLALSLLCGVAGVALGIALGRSRQLDALVTVAPAVSRPSPSAGDPGDALHDEVPAELPGSGAGDGAGR